MCIEVVVQRTALEIKNELIKLKNKEWLAFFHNFKNKQCLFGLFATYICGNGFVPLCPLPILVNKEMKNSKFHLNTTIKKPIRESFSMHYSRRQMEKVVQKIRRFLF